jgi:trk system potassium uptake protein TrkA
MAETKRFVVLGLGSFGSALARRLSNNGARVTGVDASRDHVDELKNDLYEAVVGDVTDRDTLEHLGLNNATAVFVSLGESIEPSLLATLHAKELGARRILVKGVTDEHGKILKHLGVERVIFPEVEMAQELADRMMWPNVLDFLPIDPEYGFAEIAVPTSLSGRTLRDSDLRRRYGIWVVGVKDALSGDLQIIPDGDFVLNDDQLLLVIGKKEGLNRFRGVS